MRFLAIYCLIKAKKDKTSKAKAQCSTKSINQNRTGVSTQLYEYAVDKEYIEYILQNNPLATYEDAKSFGEVLIENKINGKISAVQKFDAYAKSLIEKDPKHAMFVLPFFCGALVPNNIVTVDESNKISKEYTNLLLDKTIPNNAHNNKLKMRVVPKGAGWMYVYIDSEKESLDFIISNFLGYQFNDFLRALCALHDDFNSFEDNEDVIEYESDCCKAKFTWNEEGSKSNWTLERGSEGNGNFPIKITIVHERRETNTYVFETTYKDFCYTVSKACTEMLKRYGFFGYNYSTYTEDLNIRYLLFIKAIALEKLEYISLDYQESERNEVTSDITKEIELLLMNM